MSTPHNNAEKGDFAETVLMAGDPLRVKFIAENYLNEVRCVNDIRGMYAYTGKYMGTPVSVMGHGMGIPSIGIYTYELFHFYDVQNIIRIGSAGSLQEYVNLKDIVFAVGAHTDSNYGFQYGLHGTFCPTASYGLLERALAIAREKDIKCHVGNILTSDVYYADNCDEFDRYRDLGALAVDMETSALYMNAAEAKKNALAMLTISDCIYKEEDMSADDRQTGFNDMIEIALMLAAPLK